MEVQNKWDPGKEPYHAFHAGTVQKPGVTLRAQFAVDILSAIISSDHPAKTVDEIVEHSLSLADALIIKLYPAPVSKTQMNTGHIGESSSCAHDGEIIMQNGRFQCMKCKNAVTNEQIQSKMKKGVS